MNDTSIDYSTRDIDAAREAALEHLAEAWNAAENDGIDRLIIAHASMSAALATMVRQQGEDATAQMVASLADRIREGAYSLHRSLQ
ncbi:MAG TPA: hypothetical protein VG757_09745 [Devosia sp.]|nr:hypothetical protein [Devosia sp.]